MSTTGTDIHGIDDSIIDRVVNASKVVSDYKDKIIRLKAGNFEKDEEITSLLNKIDKFEQESTVDVSKSKVIRVWVCDICNEECKSLSGLKIHKTRMHKDKK